MELKFKVFDKEIGQYIKHGMKDKLVKKCFGFTSRNEMILQQDKFLFLPSTGLYDKNGNEIYIGDKVRQVGDIEVYEVVINDFSKIPVVDSDLGQMELHRCHNAIEIVGDED